MTTLRDIQEGKLTRLYVALACIFVCNALVAEMVGGKIFSVEETLGYEPLSITIAGVQGLGFNMTAGIFLWPVVFVMTDIINEYFGVRAVKFLSYLTVGLIAYAFVMIYGTIHLTPNQWWDLQSGLNEDVSKSISSMDQSYAKVMGQGLWIIVGSMVAFLIGQIVDVLVFHKIKSKTGEGKVWLRATGSTLISQLIDSFVVLFIAFYIGQDWDLVRVLAVGLVGYTYKFVVAVLLTPVIYLVHHLIDSYLGHAYAEQIKIEASGGE